MKTAVYWGCVIPNTQYAYELSVREVLPRLGVELVDLEGVSCCGTPVRSVNMNAFLYLATRNLAIAEKTNLKDLLVLCSGCHLSFSEAMHYLSQNEKLREKIDSLLRDEGLEYKGSIRMWYIIDLLYNIVKKETIQKSTKKTLNGLRLASHYGCHTIRPSSIERVDDPENPRKLDELIEWLGARSEAYPEKLDCCGALLLWSHHDAAFTFAGLKLKAIQDRGFDGLVVTCPACHMMFDERQKVVASTVGSKLDLPVLYYTQLLGIAMGIEEEKLGLHLNRSPVD
ncbi:MAG: disulfide reductase, partial [Candidatus Korarchaeota archaeon]|nr:disulfide reductase [Candidatus Korarchaeota archaeon]